MAMAAATAPLSLQLLLPRGSLLLGSGALQWLGVRVCMGGALLHAASLALSGWAELDIPAAQTVLLRVRSGTPSNGAWTWARVPMEAGSLPLPCPQPGCSLVVWLRARAGCQSPLRAAEAGEATKVPAVAHTTLRLSAAVRHSGFAGAVHTFATSLPVPAVAPFRAAAAAKCLPGAGSTCTALHVRLVSQLHTRLLLRAVALRPQPNGGAACGAERCACTHAAAPLLALPMPLPAAGEAAALFLLQPCACASVGALEVRYEPDHPTAVRAQGSDSAGGDSAEEADGGAHALPPDELDPACDAPGVHTCCIAVRLPDVPAVRVATLTPQLGRVGESVRVSWRVQRLPPEPQRVAAAAPAPVLVGDEAAATSASPGRDPHGEAPAYEADDERDDLAHAAEAPEAPCSAPPPLQASPWLLRWELRAPASRWLLLSAREGALQLAGSDDAATLTAECVPVLAGELAAPTLALRWHASGAAVRGVWDDPPSAPLVRVLPACE
jgi:hypothetical protein